MEAKQSQCNLNLKIFSFFNGVPYFLMAFIACWIFIVAPISKDAFAGEIEKTSNQGVCPPFYLKDEQGQVIDPVNGVNADKPYSPRKTCGECHDYEKITRGFHFTQGAGEKPTDDQKARCQWTLTPGNYGGTWCSPAPLYRYLSSKQNSSPATMDMTSFTFITAGCGDCHPGGGSAEFDREGKRYDSWMSNPQSGFVSGGDNNFDGDYYKARWGETGVLEADCFLCHLPEYNFSERKKQIRLFNLKWAAAAGSGLARVEGSIAESTPVSVTYDRSKFDKTGTLSPHIVKDPRNYACLSCHDQPGWKKRGANYRDRTDVHIRAGMKCVDCHPAGSSASDPRINGKEEHQIAKGDDPGGHVRDDLDNTCKDCADCHSTGERGAPVAKHQWLPPVHLARIACQTCHIPERMTKSAQVQAGDVFNPGTKIPDKGKHLWTFYGPDMKYYNHYGYLGMMGFEDKPAFSYRPVLTKYKGKVYPVNRVHSAWPAIETEGEPGLMQPRMSDIYKMWTDYFNNESLYPSLAEIRDDNGDNVPEINRPEEINALIEAVGSMLNRIGYPMEGKRVVWAMDDRIYSSGNKYRQLSKEEWEASPYANVHKYNHDVYPAKSALGVNGCRDCHDKSSDFFFASVVQYPFDWNGDPVTIPQHKLLGIQGKSAKLSAWREYSLKALAPWFIAALLALIFIHFTLFGPQGKREIESQVLNQNEKRITRFRTSERFAHLLVFVSFIPLGLTGFSFLLGDLSPLGIWARDFHSWLGWLFIIGLSMTVFLWLKEMRFEGFDWQWLAKLGGYLGYKGQLPAGKFNAGQKIFFWLMLILSVVLGTTGIIMFFARTSGTFNLALIYTLHDLAAVFLLVLVLGHIYLGVLLNTESIRSLFGGRVLSKWAEDHHPNWKCEKQ
jgi:formate dehydrogenase gamma subunit